MRMHIAQDILCQIELSKMVRDASYFNRNRSGRLFYVYQSYLQ